VSSLASDCEQQNRTEQQTTAWIASKNGHRVPAVLGRKSPGGRGTGATGGRRGKERRGSTHQRLEGKESGDWDPIAAASIGAGSLIGYRGGVGGAS